MREELFNAIIIRLSRSKNANMIWVVRNVNEIRRAIEMFRGSSLDYKYNQADRILRFENITIRFVLEDDSGEKLMGLLIDEVIVDEA